MPHALTELNLAEVTRPASEPGHEFRADVCVVGAGIAGLSAAIESARLHRDVVLVDSLPLVSADEEEESVAAFAYEPVTDRYGAPRHALDDGPHRVRCIKASSPPRCAPADASPRSR